MTIRSGEGACVLTLEVLQTLQVLKFLGVCCGGDKFPEVSGSEVNMDC
jgi:hypothetical protein